jgi:hypothetical protein
MNLLKGGPDILGAYEFVMAVWIHSEELKKARAWTSFGIQVAQNYHQIRIQKVRT